MRVQDDAVSLQSRLRWPHLLGVDPLKDAISLSCLGTVDGDMPREKHDSTFNLGDLVLRGTVQLFTKSCTPKPQRSRNNPVLS